jgi:hypothetical protein
VLLGTVASALSAGVDGSKTPPVLGPSAGARGLRALMRVMGCPGTDLGDECRKSPTFVQALLGTPSASGQRPSRPINLDIRMLSTVRPVPSMILRRRRSLSLSAMHS